jgi:hypothetical protein
MLMAFDNIVEAKRVLAVLGKRLARYGLTLHPDKTRLVGPPALKGVQPVQFGRHQECPIGAFSG